MSMSRPWDQGAAYPADPPKVTSSAPPAPKVHEVWANPGMPDEQQVYRGNDPHAAALCYSAAVQTYATKADEVIWTIDGYAHQHQRRSTVEE